MNITEPVDFVEATDEDFTVTDEDYALYIVFDDINAPAGSRTRADYIAQRFAIHDLLERQKAHDDLLQGRMKAIAEFAKQAAGIVNQQAIDEWGEHFHASIYQDAAHSMAAVGMLAPLLESIFRESFSGIRRIFETNKVCFSSHPRWPQATEKFAEEQWDYRFVRNRKRGWSKSGVHKGVFELADALGLTNHLPNDYKPTLKALFEYRNKMFHNGFEWPPSERERFHRRIKDAKWPPVWFEAATYGNEPWMFYLTDTFIRHCLTTIDHILSGIGAFARTTTE